MRGRKLTKNIKKISLRPILKGALSGEMLKDEVDFELQAQEKCLLLLKLSTV